MDSSLEVRFMRDGEYDRVRELIVGLQTYQKMTICPRLPTSEDIKRELSHVDKSTGIRIANNLHTYVAVAIDKSKESLGDNSHIVGYLIYGHAFSIKDGPHIWLSSFFIEADYRKRGLGKKLMELIFIHAKSLGFTHIDVPTMNNNVDGNAFYDKYSATYVNEEYKIMSRPLDR